MRIVGPEQSWLILLPSRREALCLRRLALGCGYRICELCSELECSERYLHEVFLRDIGLPPKKWMRAERMVVAIQKLADGRAPEEVAMDLGFASAGGFRREFLGFYQMAPQDFQRERMKIAEEGIRKAEVEEEDRLKVGLRAGEGSWGCRRPVRGGRDGSCGRKRGAE